MKNRVYIAGLVTILAAFIIIILGASFVDAKAASRNEGQPKNIGSSKDVNSSLDVSPSKGSETKKETSVSFNESTLDKESKNKINQLVDSYSLLAEKYNKVVSLYKENDLFEDEATTVVIKQAEEIMTELGNTELESMTEDELLEVTESMELLNEIFDQLITGIGSISETKTDEIIEAKYDTPDFSVTTVDGDSFTLYEQGGNVVVLSFFASWCEPCKREMKNLQKLYEEYGEAGVKIISIGCGESTSTVKSYMKDRGYTFLAAADSKGQISSDYNISAIPHCIIFARDGSVVAEYDGLADLEEMRNAIESAK